MGLHLSIPPEPHSIWCYRLILNRLSRSIGTIIFVMATESSEGEAAAELREETHVVINNINKYNSLSIKYLNNCSYRQSLHVGYEEEVEKK